ncbi:T9SS sorting signal type C domain-containing protein [Flavobacterium akiainvivens]|nr:T9SS sorting signal type C domain-containing protein [Flavobacterium akiainvivens]SFQ46359.1 hypothetical protein SAMN05444144_10595 [Flavobacterium akiainvivens]
MNNFTFNPLSKRSSIITTVFTAALLFFNSSAQAQCPDNPAGDQTTYGQDEWIGYVYSGYETGNPPASPFTGTYRGFVTEAATFDHDYGGNAMEGDNICGYYFDDFAVRYKMQKTYAPGYYRFTVGGDDGVRLSLDGGNTFVTPADSWTNHGYVAYNYDITIEEETTLNIIVEFYEAGGGARVSFNSSLLTCNATAPTEVTGNVIYSCNGYTTLYAQGGTENGATYQWGYGSVVGTNPASGFNTPTWSNVTQPGTYWVRRVLASPCNGHTDGIVFNVTTSANTPGNPAEYGDNQWNVYTSHINTNTNPHTYTYKGYYTDSALTVNSENMWASGASPSAAATWTGCAVENDYFGFVYKRKGFTCGEYNLTLQKWDDHIKIYIDGTQVNFANYTLGNGGAINPNGWEPGPANANLGNYHFGADTTIEIVIDEYQGGANVKLDITPVYQQPTSITSSNTGAVCPGTDVTLTAVGGMLKAGQTYQWGTGTTGQNIISGATDVTATVAAQAGTTYWVRIVPNECDGTGEGAATTISVLNSWAGAVDSNWHNGANWCGGVPTIDQDVVIDTTMHNPEVTLATAAAKSITITTGASVTVKTGGTLTVQNAVVTNGALTIENNAALVQVNNVANTGAASVWRNSNELYRLDYTLWGSPVQNQVLFDFSPETAIGRFYTYGLNSNGDENYLQVADPTTTEFANGTGYLIRMPNDLPAIPGYNGGTTKIPFYGNFNGVPNNGDITVPAGNLVNHYIAVANPYASPISVTEFFNQNSSVLEAGEGIYFWRKRNNALETSYAHLTMAGFTANEADGGDMDGDNGDFYYAAAEEGEFNANWIISPGQGFIVKLRNDITAAHQVTFSNSMREGAPVANGQPFFRTQNTNNAPAVSRWWINLNGASAFSQALVSYMPQGTAGLDYGYDARSFADGTAALYSKAGQDNLAIQARPQFEVTDVVPLGFNATVAGEYTLSLDRVDGLFAQGQAIFVKDNLTGTTYNLQEGAYTFTTGAGAFDTRFEVYYETDALGIDQPELANMVLIYQQNGAINITSGAVEMTAVTLYDIRGRKLYEQNGINATTATVSNLNAGNQVIIVEIETVKGKVTKKIVY